MNQSEFNKLLDKYLEGKCSPEEVTLIEEWSEKNAHQGSDVLSEAQKQVVETRIWGNIQKNTTGLETHQQATPPQYRRLFWYAAAASLAILIASTVYFFKNQLNDDNTIAAIKDLPANSDFQVKNISERAQEFRLEDGSLVVLEPQSELSYHGQFGDKERRVYLKGTAFFNVKKDSTKPFLVHTTKVTTEVLGTSFTVKTDEKQQSVEVSVRSGKVMVYENVAQKNQSKRGVLLNANQKIQYTNSNAQLVPSLVEKPTLQIDTLSRLDLVFEDATLPEVLDKLKAMYGLDVIVSNKDLNKCLLTADLNNLNMFTQLDLICKSISARYEVRGTYVFIEGIGCDE